MRNRVIYLPLLHTAYSHTEQASLRPSHPFSSNSIAKSSSEDYRKLWHSLLAVQRSQLCGLKRVRSTDETSSYVEELNNYDCLTYGFDISGGALGNLFTLMLLFVRKRKRRRRLLPPWKLKSPLPLRFPTIWPYKKPR